MKETETPYDIEYTGKSCKKCGEGTIVIAKYHSGKTRTYCQNCWLEESNED